MGPLDAFYAPQVTAAASRLEHAAARSRHRAGLLSAAVAACEWDGAGARAYRHRAHDTLTHLRRAASDLDDAAAALRRHADRVADHVAREVAEEHAERAAAAERTRRKLVELGELAHRIGLR